MRFPAYLLSKAGAVIRPAVVELSDTDLPEGEVLVRVEWSAINFKDAMVTRPGNRVARVFPLVPGVELTGSVEESTSPEFTPGQTASWYRATTSAWTVTAALPPTPGCQPTGSCPCPMP